MKERKGVLNLCQLPHSGFISSIYLNIHIYSHGAPGFIYIIFISVLQTYNWNKSFMLLILICVCNQMNAHINTELQMWGKFKLRSINFCNRCCIAGPKLFMLPLGRNICSFHSYKSKNMCNVKVFNCRRSLIWSSYDILRSYRSQLHTTVNNEKH